MWTETKENNIGQSLERDLDVNGVSLNLVRDWELWHVLIHAVNST